MPPSGAASNGHMMSSSFDLFYVAQEQPSLPSPSSVIIVLLSAPPPPALPSVTTSCTLPPLLIVIFLLILTPSSHLTSPHPFFCQYTPRSPHVVRVTQKAIKHSVGWCVVLTNPMDCAQTKCMRHRPWCVDDTYALGWGALTPHAMVWAKAAQYHGCGDSIKIFFSAQDGFLNLDDSM